jgi:N-carbamoyl-L-amino-acid hydrolase
MTSNEILISAPRNGSNRSITLGDRVDMDRFWLTLDRSAEIGKGRENGLARLALSDSDKEMRDTFVRWCEEAGLSVTIDQMGSIFARREGAEDLPPVLIGSHLDTQVNGGRFDGIVGVLGALEVMRRLNDLGIGTRRPIEIVDWSNEEGARFSPPMTASGCFTGAYALEWAYDRVDDKGLRLGDELERIGYKGDAPVGGRQIDSYLELHIEQADTLYAAGVEVGVVTHGFTSYGVLAEFKGATAHTGPHPMEKRQNALVAGARFLTAVDDIGLEHAATGGKATGARLVAWPNTAGILSDWAQAVCDVRHDDAAVARAMHAQMLAALHRAAEVTHCQVEILDQWNWGGRIFDDAMISRVRAASHALGYSSLDLPSQAGHDAYFLAKMVPTAMIFTPSVDGISHSNLELSTREHIEPGLNVLLHAAVAQANRD